MTAQEMTDQDNAGTRTGDALPEGLLLAYYGDDFTGSTDAMEAMAMAGVPTVLFLEKPSAPMLARFPGVRCVGLAGSSRGRSPAWMREHLRDSFASLAQLGAPLLQYKICSTFDSSPGIGSIGCAIDLGIAQMGGRWSPTIVGAPRLKRYQVFGNLFAAVDGVGYRLDRHPTMARHPVTPMAEADLRLHLGQQTSRRIELIDMVQLKHGIATAAAGQLAGDDTPVVLIDVCDEDTLAAAGRLVWEHSVEPVFSASSSGLEYALVAYWRSAGVLPPAPEFPPASPVDVVAAVSGSCSPVTAGQIACAREHGWRVMKLDIASVLDESTRAREVERVVALARDAVATMVSPLVCSAEGPDDPAVLGFDRTASAAGLTRQDAARLIGEALAEVMRQLLDSCPLRRIVVAGGDSSGEVTAALGISALTVLAPMAPGAPLCRAWSGEPARDGLQIVLKGGQIGPRSFFVDVLHGLSPVDARAFQVPRSA